MKGVKDVKGVKGGCEGGEWILYWGCHPIFPPQLLRQREGREVKRDTSLRLGYLTTTGVRLGYYGVQANL